MKRTHIVAGLLAGLTAGAGAGFALTQGGSAGAAGGVEAAVTVGTDVTTTEPTGDGSTTGDGATTGDGTAPGGDAASADADRDDRIREALAPLVDDGTLTEAQVDAVVTALADVLPDGGRGGHGPRGMGGGLDAAATALGLDVADLMSQLQDGSTIAEVAAAQGVDVQTVIDAMVAAAQAHLDEEVTEGDLTQEEADTALAQATDEITSMVNEGWTMPGDGDGAAGTGMGMGGPGMGGMGHGHGGRGDDGDGDGDGAASSTTVDTTGAASA